MSKNPSSDYPRKNKQITGQLLFNIIHSAIWQDVEADLKSTKRKKLLPAHAIRSEHYKLVLEQERRREERTQLSSILWQEKFVGKVKIAEQNETGQNLKLAELKRHGGDGYHSSLCFLESNQICGLLLVKGH